MPLLAWADQGQSERAGTADGEEKKLLQNRESLNEKLFLFLMKTVFAKFDSRLG